MYGKRATRNSIGSFLFSIPFFSEEAFAYLFELEIIAARGNKRKRCMSRFLF
jgi:hypothetical protein